jgi:hypothetical protein
LGPIFSIPGVQALPETDTSAVVAWIDIDRGFSSLIKSGGTKAPTGDGGDINARLMSRDGVVERSSLPGFPLRTRAQCLQLGRIAGRPFIVWIGSEKTGLKINLLPLLEAE